MTLNEDIQKGTGNIVIKKSSDNSVVETIDVNSLQVTLCDTAATIDPATTLVENTGYYVEVDAGAFEDLVRLRLRWDQWIPRPGISPRATSPRRRPMLWT